MGSVATLADISTEIFGGLNTSMPPSDLPPGASPLNQDIEFPEGAVKTRNGESPVFTTIAGNPSITGVKTYQTPDYINRLLVLAASGNLYRENSPGALTLVSSDILPNLLAQSNTLFGREYMMFYDGATGSDIPRQYDDTNFDRLSQGGVGAPPTIAPFLPPGATIIATAFGAVRANNQATITTTAPHGFTVGQSVTIAGLPNQQLPYTSLIFTAAAGIVTVTLVGGSTTGLIVGTNVIIANVSDPTFNGTFPIQDVLNGTQFTYAAITVTNAPSSSTPAGALATVLPSAGHEGTSYNVGDIVTINGGNFLGTVQITSVTAFAGAVLAMVVVNPGAAYVAGTAQLTTGGSGTGLEVDTTTNGAVLASASTSFNGTFTIESIPTPTSFTYQNLGPNLNLVASGGTATVVGNISGGLHGLSVAFITRQGYITIPAPPVYFYAPGNQLATVSNIPIGPSNIVGRLLIFTPYIAPPATAGAWYAVLPNMQINDNTTTSLVIDFTDTALIAGFSADYLFSQQELGECTFVAGYNSRTVALGERFKIPNFVNTEFDGGWNLGGGVSGSDVPLGWSVDGSFLFGNAGGSRDTVNGDWQDGYRVTGDGSSIVRGIIKQSAYQDFNGVAIINRNVGYSYRVRLVQSGLTAGGFFIEVYSPTVGYLGQATVPFNLIPTGRNQEFTGELIFAPGFATIPPDAVLRVYGGNTMNAGGWFTMDSIEIFPTLNPVNASNVRLSYVNNPESIDGITGNVTVRPGDGQTLRAGFPLRTAFYVGKDHYLGYFTDDGKNEPSSWQFTEVSATIGICGPRAVAWTEEWAVFAERSGLYILMGGDPIKIMQEIQEDASQTGKICWNSINWNYGYKIWIVIDQIKKRILVGAPVNGATSPNVIFLMDYRFNSTPEYIASGPGVVYSQFTGGLLSHGASRKWTIWNLSCPSGGIIERFDGTAELFLGGTSDGNVYNLPASSYLDNGQPIVSFWQGYGMPANREEHELQTLKGPLRSHNKLCGYLSGRVIGSATLPGAVSTIAQITTGIVRVSMSLAHNLAVGDYVIVSTAVDTTYNGWFKVVSVPSVTDFTYLRTTAKPSTTGATVSGTLNIYAIGPDRTIRVRGVSLTQPDPSAPAADFERPMNIMGERIFFKVGTSVPGAWFQMEKMISSMKQHPTAPVRGRGL